MNPDPRSILDQGRNVAWMIGVIGTLAIMAIMVTVLLRVTRPEDLAAIRARERLQFLEEVQAAEALAISRYAWQDQAKGLVRVPIERAMELVIKEWQDPAAARSNLIARVEVATALPPEPENPYE
jgi:hypothetical protein